MFANISNSGDSIYKRNEEWSVLCNISHIICFQWSAWERVISSPLMDNNYALAMVKDTTERPANYRIDAQL